MDKMDDFAKLREERLLSKRMRDAIEYCKSELQVISMIDIDLPYEERVNFERCLTKNFLLEYGMDYFGKRELIFLDLHGTADVKRLTSTNLNS